jgi:hypothetical protein
MSLSSTIPLYPYANSFVIGTAVTNMNSFIIGTAVINTLLDSIFLALLPS